MGESNIKTSKKYRINKDICVPKVRVINESGEQIGVLSIREALDLAKEQGLDLVEVVPTVEPPVCKIMDYGKHSFKLSKQKMGAKKQKRQKLKQLRIHPRIGEQDYQVKLTRAKAFLEEGNKVEFDVRFRGREVAHREFGLELLKRVEKDLEELADVAQAPLMQGRQLMMVFVPKKKN
jgi:translation initiation factor IF-3